MASSFAAQRLPDRAVVRLTGEAPLAFLNNLLTCDLSATPPGQWAYGALLSAQGKIQHDVFLLLEGNSIFVDCAASQAQGLVQKLKLYRLRAKIEITLDETLAIAVGSAEGPGAKDPRAAALGRRSIVNHGVLDGGSGYHAARIALGLADSSMDIGENRLFPHEANLDLLGGVSFSKGCYIGQEVVSRMQHRGTARSRILGVSSSTALPAPGSAITSGETHVGEMLSSVETRGLALIRLDRLAEAREPLLTSSVRLTVHKPGWMTVPFTIPDQAA